MASLSERTRGAAWKRGWPWWAWALIACLALGLVLLAWGTIVVEVVTAPTRRVSSLLHSPDPADRKQGAWLTADEASEVGLVLVRDLLPREADPDVRESYVYALGRLGHAGCFDNVQTVIGGDDSGYVRQAAWLAAARIDPQRFRELAASRPPPVDPWDRIGVAQAWLLIGDTRGLDTLFHWAAQGDHGQRVVAARALYRSVRPALEAAGRWPIGADVREGEPWPASLLTEIERRCQELDLPAAIRDSRPHLDKAQGVRRNLLRLMGARQRIAWLLFRR